MVETTYMLQTAKLIYQHLNQAKKVIIIPHQNPDGDALGSAGALKDWLITNGISVEVFCATPASVRWHFVPHAEKVSTVEQLFKDDEVDTIVVLDSGDLRYAGVDKHVSGHSAHIINIDHHATNEKYGHTNMVMTTASATCEILFYFFKHNNIHVNPTMATALLTGIITDTDNFTNSATTTAAMLVAGELLRHGGNLNLINTHYVRNKTLNTLKLWGVALSRLAKDENTGITYTFITQQDLVDNHVSENEVDGISNFLNNLEGNKISLVLKETTDGKIKGSFRTALDDMDVSAIAKKLGGGGHKKAAGFAVAGTIDDVLKIILTK